MKVKECKVNDFVRASYNGGLVIARIISLDARENMSSKDHQVKIKPLGSNKCLWVSPDTEVLNV